MEFRTGVRIQVRTPWATVTSPSIAAFRALLLSLLGRYNALRRTRKQPTVKARPRQFETSSSNPHDKPRVRPIGSLVNQLMSRRGYAQVVANETLHEAIASILDEHLRSAFQVGNLRRGVLQVFASDSVTLQELNFRKRAILKHLQATVPENKVTDLRFRIQA